MGLFENRQGKIPVWFMRQAGRYHAHYQALRQKHSFMELCKNPKLACEVTLGPIQDFNFDAAILFSDLLFPLEYLGMGLSYEQGPPTLELKIQSKNDIEKLKMLGDVHQYFSFQKEALQLLKKRLPADTTLLGFVGAPFTLYAYASEGSHKDGLHHSKRGLYDGRFDLFLEKLLPVLEAEMEEQAKGGADAVCLFDTAVGELSPQDFQKYIIPSLSRLTKNIKSKFPNQRIVYYSKNTQKAHLRLIASIAEIDVMGIDWKNDLSETLREFGSRLFIQGNIDPDWLFLPWPKLEKRLNELWNHMHTTPHLSHWIFGLGHGVLPQTPEENVKKSVAWIHEHCRY